MHGSIRTPAGQRINLVPICAESRSDFTSWGGPEGACPSVAWARTCSGVLVQTTAYLEGPADVPWPFADEPRALCRFQAQKVGRHPASRASAR